MINAFETKCHRLRRRSDRLPDNEFHVEDVRERGGERGFLRSRWVDLMQQQVHGLLPHCVEWLAHNGLLFRGVRRKQSWPTRPPHEPHPAMLLHCCISC
jgi:hypothetical protein